MGLEEPRPPPRRWRVLPAAAALLFAVLAFDAARLETATIDEFAHVATSYALVFRGAQELYGKNPPLGRALLALPGLFVPVRVPPVREPSFGWGPWAYGRRFMRANAARYLELVTGSRLVAIVMAIATAALLFLWTRSLFGERPAAVVSALFLLSPTVLAHGHLATVDMTCTAAIFASALLLRRACLEGAAWRLALAGAMWGVALLVKFTAVLLLPAYAAILLLRRGRRVGRGLGELALLGVVAVGVVNLGMGFRGSFAPLGSYTMRSDFGRALQGALPAALPVPLPAAWTEGFDAQKYDVEHAEFPSYLCGKWSRDGFWYYEGVALLVKTPLPFLAMLLACPLALARRRPSRLELAFLLVPVAVLGFMLTAFNALNVGIRYLLPLFPFAFVLIGALFAGPGRRAGALGLALVAWYAVTAVRVHPSYLSYFNAAAGGSSQGYRWLLDSNFDWGQDLYRLPAALARLSVHEPISLLYLGHVDPALYGIEFRRASSKPESAVIAASVSYLEGFSYPSFGPDGRPMRVGRNHLAWLRNREPVAKLGSIWVFDTRRSGAP